MLRIVHTDSVPSSAIESSLQELRKIISQRLTAYLEQGSFNLEEWFRQKNGHVQIEASIKAAVPQLNRMDEWIILIMSLAPHIQPDFFQAVIGEFLPQGGDFPDFGGVKGSNHRGILPTGETAQFVIAGNDTDKRLQVQQLFEENHFFYQNDILWLEAVKEGEPVMSGRIILSPK